MNILYRLYHRYDQIPEPRRFYVFLICAFPLIIAMSVDNFYVSGSAVVFALLVLASRALYFNRNKT